MKDQYFRGVMALAIGYLLLAAAYALSSQASAGDDITYNQPNPNGFKGVPVPRLPFRLWAR